MPPVSSQEDTPVAIVGGGPAGLAAAIALAQAGVSVVVLERGSWPRDKVCGEGVMPTGVAVLDRLGVLPLIAPEQCRPFRGIDWLNVAGAGVGGDFAQGAGLKEAPASHTTTEAVTNRDKRSQPGREGLKS